MGQSFKSLVIKCRRLFVLSFIAIGIKLFSLFPDAVEKYYATGIYPRIASLQRAALGWIPFSFGDLLYGLAIIWLIIQLVRLIKRALNRTADRRYLRQVALRFIGYTLGVYIVFNILWGLNYNRRGIAYQLQLKTERYSKEELVAVTEELALKLNALQPLSLPDREKLKRKKYLFAQTVNAYGLLSLERSEFDYVFPSVKPSIYSYLGNYLGFTGYYNPFTGEAQVNTTIPGFARPFTACHEVGHQLGYAKENEANFAGYLSASASSNKAFQYSVYFDLYAYAGRYLYMVDSMTFKTVNQLLSPAVKQDREELRKFFSRYSSPLEEAIDRLYAQYLAANEQPSGKMSYNEVVALLIAYYKKFGHL